MIIKWILIELFHISHTTSNQLLTLKTTSHKIILYQHYKQNLIVTKSHK